MKLTFEELESVPSNEFTKEDWATYKAAWIADWINETDESKEIAGLRWGQMLNQEGLTGRDEDIYARRDLTEDAKS